MSSIFKGNINVSIFGESHGAGIGVVIDGLPAGEKINMQEVSHFMKRRAPKSDGTSTYRHEKDIPEVLSGMLDGVTTGAPLAAIIRNTDTKSGDYKNISHLARPAHADYTAYVRYNGFNDIKGGGHFSGRLTAPLCFAGAICTQILANRGIYIGAHIKSIHDVHDDCFNPVSISYDDIKAIHNRDFPVINKGIMDERKSVILNARNNLASVGGIVECCAIGVPAGIGSPMFAGLENIIASAMFAIPAVKGIEFGAGFDSTRMTGSENNDEFYIEEDTVKTRTNHHGGILGGISSGMPIMMNVAFKPTPSIARPQRTIDYQKAENATIEIKGRHDPCIVPRAVPCVESIVGISLLSSIDSSKTL